MRAMEQDFEEYQLVNMDAIRGNGPAGRGNKLTYAGHPDHISPFFEQYGQWFKHGVVKAIDYGTQTVCFKKAVFQVREHKNNFKKKTYPNKNKQSKLTILKGQARSSPHLDVSRVW